MQILIFWMLRNNADAHRCSYFELGLPVRIVKRKTVAGLAPEFAFIQLYLSRWHTRLAEIWHFSREASRSIYKSTREGIDLKKSVEIEAPGHVPLGRLLASLSLLAKEAVVWREKACHLLSPKTLRVFHIIFLPHDYTTRWKYGRSRALLLYMVRVT